MARLITIPLSHYCERARWALDACGVAYTEEQHLQMLHRWAVRRAGGQRTVPVLIAKQGVFTDSSDIVRFADSTCRDGARLYPGDAQRRAVVEDAERELEGSYGVSTRLLAYDMFFAAPRVLLRYNGANAPLWQRGLLRACFPLAKRQALKLLSHSPAAVERARQHVARVFSWVARELADGRRYLCGDEFTAADLTYASLTAALVLPRQYGVALPALDELPDEIGEIVARYRAHPAGQFALRVYELNR